MLEKTLDCKEIQPFHPKGNQSWVFIGTTDVEVEAPILWLPDGKTDNRLMEGRVWEVNAIHLIDAGGVCLGA